MVNSFNIFNSTWLPKTMCMKFTETKRFVEILKILTCMYENGTYRKICILQQKKIVKLLCCVVWKQIVFSQLPVNGDIRNK